MAKGREKCLVIVGTTASGKTTLAVDSAWQYGGEIISADSRQVYKYMDIGTGKDLAEYRLHKNSKIYKIPYHLIDVVHPNTLFNLSKWLQLARRAFIDIRQRRKIPIIAGGSGLYTQALVENFNLSTVKENKALRKELADFSPEQVFKKLQIQNKSFANRLNDSDKKNKQRLIRYLEIGQEGEIDRKKSGPQNNVDYLFLGLTHPKNVLKQRIDKRLLHRLEKEAMLEEVEILHKKYRVSWHRLESFGLEYKFISKYLRKKISYDKMIININIASRQFAKRQMSWLRRWEKQGRKIYWPKNENEAKKLIANFMANN